MDIKSMSTEELRNELNNRIQEELKQRAEKFRLRQEAYESGVKYTDDELRYSAYSRCECGAGLAYPKDCGINHYWDCADILTGRAIPADKEGAKQHAGQLPFMFYEIKSEDQPSANGATTRPNIKG